MYLEFLKRSACGAFLIVFGAFFLSESFSYKIGTLARMGPGFYPMLFGGLLILLGLAIAVRDIVKGSTNGPVNLRSFFFIGLSILAFAFGLAWFGVVPAIMSAVLISAFAQEKADILSSLLTGMVVCLFTWSTFIKLLGLPLKLFELPI